MIDHLEVLTIYENPSDYAGKFVVRPSIVTADGVVRMAPLPLAICDTLDEARASIEEHHPGLVRLHRMPGDDPVIVETWL